MEKSKCFTVRQVLIVPRTTHKALNFNPKQPKTSKQDKNVQTKYFRHIPSQNKFDIFSRRVSTDAARNGHCAGHSFALQCRLTLVCRLQKINNRLLLLIDSRPCCSEIRNGPGLSCNLPFSNKGDHTFRPSSSGSKTVQCVTATPFWMVQ